MDTYYRNPTVVERRLRDTCLLVPVMATFEELDSLYSLNETAHFIWRKACDGLDDQGIALQLAESYDVPIAQAQTDTQAVISELCEMQLLAKSA